VAEPATLTVDYAGESAELEESSLGLHYLSPGSHSGRQTPFLREMTVSAALAEVETWVLLPGNLDTLNHVLTAEADQLGTFAVLGESTPKSVYMPVVVRAGSGCREAGGSVGR
jgi:hypothetical protein